MGGMFDSNYPGADEDRKRHEDKRIADLEAANARLREENRRLKQQVDSLMERVDSLMRLGQSEASRRNGGW